jgi:hypothetical protein
VDGIFGVDELDRKTSVYTILGLVCWSIVGVVRCGLGVCGGSMCRLIFPTASCFLRKASSSGENGCMVQVVEGLVC